MRSFNWLGCVIDFGLVDVWCGQTNCLSHHVWSGHCVTLAIHPGCFPAFGPTVVCMFSVEHVC